MFSVRKIRLIIAIAVLFVASFQYFIKQPQVSHLQSKPTPEILREEAVPEDISPTDAVSIIPSAIIEQKFDPPGEKAQVTRVVDGDTIKVLFNGQSKTVRLIGIDTPETVDPRKPVQCFGKEASNHSKGILTGQTIYLEADSTQDETDKYHRLLRYVWLSDGTNFNMQMIEDGYAYEYTYQVPYKYQEDFKQAQEDATSAKLGLWADETCAGRK